MATTVEEYFQSIPSTAELRQKLAKNQRERDLIKKLLRIAEQKERMEVVS
jgi:hypothetical protein